MCCALAGRIAHTLEEDRGTGGQETGRKGGGRCMGGGRRGGGKRDSQGGRKWEKNGIIMQQCTIFCN